MEAKKKKRIAVIGAGNMGSAIAASFATTGCEVVCTAATDATLEKVKAALPDVEVTRSNRAAADGADIVVLAVKPYVAPEVFPEIIPVMKEGAVVVSVIASLPIRELSELLQADMRRLGVARVIPNTAIRYGKSVTFIAYSDNVDADEREEITSLFDLSGKTYVVKEKDMAACTALASCGIAYFLRFIRAAAEGSVELGLKAGFATEVAALTAEGAAALLMDGSHPEAEIDKVTTPGGLTIRGLNALEAHGFTTAVVAALKASV